MGTNNIYISFVAEDKLFLFNPVTGQYKRSDVDSNTVPNNGYGDFYSIDGKEEPAFVYGSDNTVFFYFRKSYRLDTIGLTAETQSTGFSKTRFIMKNKDEILIDFVYKMIDAECDVFLDVIDWFKIKPHTRLVHRLQDQCEFFLETDFEKRNNMRFEENEPVSFMKRLREFF